MNLGKTEQVGKCSHRELSLKYKSSTDFIKHHGGSWGQMLESLRGELKILTLIIQEMGNHWMLSFKEFWITREVLGNTP